jgi:hypothetical protein
LQFAEGRLTMFVGGNVSRPAAARMLRLIPGFSRNE